MMKSTVAIAILSVFFFGQPQLQAQDSESAKAKKDEVRPAKTDEAVKDESAKKEAVKAEFDETMKDRKAELMEEAGNDPAMKDEIQAKMQEEKKAQKEVLKARYWQEQHAGKSANKDKRDRVKPATAADAVDGAPANGGLQAKTPASTDGAVPASGGLQAKAPAATDGAPTDGTLSSSGDGKKDAAQGKPVSKDGKSKQTKQAKPKKDGR